MTSTQPRRENGLWVKMRAFLHYVSPFSEVRLSRHYLSTTDQGIQDPNQQAGGRGHISLLYREEPGGGFLYRRLGPTSKDPSELGPLSVPAPRRHIAADARLAARP